MLKKSLFLIAILGMVAAVGFAESADDVEKAQRFRAADRPTNEADPEANVTETIEVDLATVDGENPFDIGESLDDLQRLAGSAQLEELGRFRRWCYWTSIGWMCF
jgi:hypothetical protein